MADCVITIFSLLLAAFVYWYRTERDYLESSNIKTEIGLLETKLSNKITDVLNRVKMIEDKEERGF